MPQPKFAPGNRGGAYTEADDFNMQIEHVNREFFLDKWAGCGWKNISVHKTYEEALAARAAIFEFLRSGAAKDGVTAPDSRERPATIKESLTVHDCFGWAWEDANGQWVFVKNSVGQEHVIACHSVALREIKVAAPQAQGEPEDDLTIAYMAGFSKGKDQMREALAETERKAAYWQEEARRYAGNADFWREKCAAKDAALDAALEALEEWARVNAIGRDVNAHWESLRELGRHRSELHEAAITKIKEARG